MNESQVRRSSKAIAGLLLAGSVVITACATPPISSGMPPQITAAVLQASPTASTAVPTPDVGRMNVTTSSATSPNGRWVAELRVATPKDGDFYYTNQNERLHRTDRAK